MCVDPLGFVYVTEHNAGQFRRVDPYTGEFTVLASGMSSANGITFNIDYDLLYIDTFDGGDNVIYIMEIDIETGEHGDLMAWVTNVGSGWHDGLGVDICGNVYVCDYQCYGEWDDTCIYRISPDGVVESQPIVHPPAHIYMPNLDWGSGIGGWDRETIFIPHGWDHTVYEVYLGIPSKPPVYP
jgi:sugar lactone lactonase YvrE